MVARFSLAVGTIATEINPREAIGMDGPAFHRAREGIESLKEEAFLFHLRMEEEPTPLSRLVNGSLQLISEEIRSWKRKRFQIMSLLGEKEDQGTIAQKVGMTRQAVYKNKRAGNSDIMTRITDSLAQLINERISK